MSARLVVLADRLARFFPGGADDWEKLLLFCLPEQEISISRPILTCGLPTSRQALVVEYRDRINAGRHR